MPYSDNVHDAIDIDMRVWLVILSALAVTLIIAYLSTRILSRNVVLLREFALSCCLRWKSQGGLRIPRNELGDISVKSSNSIMTATRVSKQ